MRAEHLRPCSTDFQCFPYYVSCQILSLQDLVSWKVGVLYYISLLRLFINFKVAVFKELVYNCVLWMPSKLWNPLKDKEIP